MDQNARPNIKALRLNKGLSVAQTAALMGISIPTLYRAERGGTLYPVTAKCIADFYGLKVTDIWVDRNGDTTSVAA